MFVRFPDYDSMVDEGFLLPHEAARLQCLENKTPFEITWWQSHKNFVSSSLMLTQSKLECSSLASCTDASHQQQRQK